LRSRKPDLRFTFDSRTHCIERERERERFFFICCESFIRVYTYIYIEPFITNRETYRQTLSVSV
jgi:hypothetical protein